MAPFTQLLMQPTGKISPCCYLQSYTVNSAGKNLEDIWNSEKLRKLRRDHLSGANKICASRLRNSACFQDFEHFRNVVFPREIMETPPQRIDVRLNGHCNLRCIMCEVWQQPNHQYDESFFWKEGSEKLFPFLKEIEIAGGEPFIQRDIFRVMHQISTVNKSCEFSFITNGNFVWSSFIESHLDQIKIKRIQVSVDAATEETYKRIRLGGEWHRVLKNIAALKSYRERKLAENGTPFQIKLSFCAQLSNWRELPDFFELCSRYDADPEIQFVHYSPNEGVSLKELSREDLELVINQIRSRLKDASPAIDPNYLHHFFASLESATGRALPRE